MTSESLTTACLRCGDQGAPIGAMCRNPLEDDNFCDEINFGEAKRVCGWNLLFRGAGPTMELVRLGLLNGEVGFGWEIVWTPEGLWQEGDDALPYLALAEQIESSIIGKTGLPFAHQADRDFYRIANCGLHPEEDGLTLRLSIEAMFFSIQSDWLEWGPLHIANDRLSDGSVWLEIDGEKLLPMGVEVDI